MADGLLAPTVSVIIPSYNHARYISRAVQSVLDQTWKDLELIVIDDGSQDDSIDVLTRLSTGCSIPAACSVPARGNLNPAVSGNPDSRMKVIAQENQGAHAAINRGLEMARGSMMAILNSDDFYHPQRLEKMITAQNNAGQAGLSGSYITIINENGDSVGEKHGYIDCEPWLLSSPERSFRAGNDLIAALQTENYFGTTSNFIFSRGCYEKVGGFRHLRYTHDWDFALRAAECGFPIQIHPEPLVSYRIHSRNTIRENQAAMIFEICWILAVHLPEYMISKSFSNEAQTRRTDQLLRSIYTYNCDRVLTLMLLQRIHQDEEKALALLNSENPDRLKFLEYIQEQLALVPAGQADSAGWSVPALPPNSLWRKIRRRLSPIKARVRHLYGRSRLR